MRGLRAVTQVVFCVILVCLLTSCSYTKWHPERYATVEEAYASPQAYQMTLDVPLDSYKKVVINAPYADVFRAVEVATTQVALNIESSDKSKGLILATRISNKPPSHEFFGGHLFYAITVKELKSRSTEIVVFVKLQARCFTDSRAISPREIQWNKECREWSSTPHWATGHNADEEVPYQLINFTRNNLYAAGAL